MKGREYFIDKYINYYIIIMNNKININIIIIIIIAEITITILITTTTTTSNYIII